jgi:hypothetical protein
MSSPNSKRTDVASIKRLWRRGCKPYFKAPPCALDAPGRAAKPGLVGKAAGYMTAEGVFGKSQTDREGHLLVAVEPSTVNVQPLTVRMTMRC